MNLPQVVLTKKITDILKAATTDRATAVMTHLSKGKWHSTKIIFTDFREKKLHIETATTSKPNPLDIQIEQPVGVSFKKDYNKYIFESVIAGFQLSQDNLGGDKIVLNLPDRVEKFQRRSYFRVAIPEGLKVQVLFWHRGYHDECNDVPSEDYWKGRLLDLSAGGMQIVVSIKHKSNFRTGQFVGLQFTPMPYEKPLLLEAQIRHIAPTADEKNLCLGVQMLGLEASGEGREKLCQLCSIVERYHQMNQVTNKTHSSSAKR